MKCCIDFRMASENVEASAEISSIVRNSIRTKLAELNSEIDDEVPDYILLMLGLATVKLDFLLAFG